MTPMAKATVEGIFVAPEREAPLQAVDAVEAVTGVGLDGDRYAARAGTYSGKEGPKRQVTLIEAEALEAAERDYGVALPPGSTRRNIVTRGVALNHLVGREFAVGPALLRGITLCEPCVHMESLAGVPGAREALVHRGGLNAEIVAGGTIRIGDPISLA